MSTLVVRINTSRPMFRQSDGVVSNSRAGKIIAKRLSSSSRGTRPNDTNPLTHYLSLRNTPTPSIAVLTPMTYANLGNWIPTDIRPLVETHLEVLQQIPLSQFSTNDVGFLDVHVSCRLGNTLRSRNITFLADLLRLNEIDLLKMSGIGRKSIVELGEILRQVTEKVSNQNRLTLEDVGDWLWRDELRTKIITHQDELAKIQLARRTNEKDDRGNFIWEWVFYPARIDVLPRAINSILRRNKESGTRRGLSPIITLTDLLVLPQKNLLETRNFGRKTLVALSRMVEALIERIEQGDLKWQTQL